MFKKLYILSLIVPLLYSFEVQAAYEMKPEHIQDQHPKAVHHQNYTKHPVQNQQQLNRALENKALYTAPSQSQAPVYIYDNNTLEQSNPQNPQNPSQ